MNTPNRIELAATILAGILANGDRYSTHRSSVPNGTPFWNDYVTKATTEALAAADSLIASGNVLPDPIKELPDQGLFPSGIAKSLEGEPVSGAGKDAPEE